MQHPDRGTDPARFFIGVNHTGRHAVPAGDTLRAIACTECAPTAFAACGAHVVIATRWSQYRRGHPIIAAAHRLCQPRAWTAALATGQVDAELAALAEDEATAAALARDWIDPRLVINLCRTILTDNTAPDDDTREAHAGEPDPRLVQLLAHASAHRSVLLLGEACVDGVCEHPADSDVPDRAAVCAADCVLACPACSLQAGEGEGRFLPECTVAAPCQVLRTMGASFAVPA